MQCVLCARQDEDVLWHDERLRVIAVDDSGLPGFCRVIWQAHVGEMTDLDQSDRDHLMHAVFAVERSLRQCLDPDKINLASLGNQVPHLHWHIVPRWRDDSYFPDSIWSAARRPGAYRPVERARLQSTLIDEFLRAGLTRAN